jgi:uncharacterized protein (TIGR03435 family)
MTSYVVVKPNIGKILVIVGLLGALASAAVIGLMNAPSILAQSAAGKQKFEVASIRRCQESGESGGRGGAGTFSPGRFTLNCQTVAGLVQSAYVFFANGQRRSVSSIPPLSGGPAWVYSDRYTINAKAENGASPEMMRGPMLQGLLEDRFKLRMRRVTRQVPVYALTVVKNGVTKFQRVKDGSCTPVDREKPSPPQLGQKPACGSGAFGKKGPNLTMDMLATSFDQLAGALSSTLDRPVINRTGVNGLFNFHLEFEPDQATPGAIPFDQLPFDANGGPPLSIDPAGTSIFTAVKELGLRLQKAKGPRQFLVIDHAEKPTEN